MTNPAVTSVAEVRVTRDDDVMTLTLSHPGKRNALTSEMYDALATQFAAADEDAALRAVVIRGDTDGGFAAGTDIATFTDFDGGADGVAYERRVGAVLRALQALPIPTIAAVHGAAVGAGLAIAASCDIVVAERGAVFGAPIARTLGNCLPAAVIHRVASRVGTARALDMLLTAALVPAEQLTATGFVARLADPGELETSVEAVVRGIRRSAPLTLQAVKESVRRLDAAAPLADNDDLLALCYGSEDFSEGVSAFFAKRHPQWKGK